MGYNPSYKWINPTYPIYNWGYNPLTKWDEPPSRIYYRMGPPVDSVQLVQITPITMVYDTQITIFGWGYKPTLTGGPHPVGLGL